MSYQLVIKCSVKHVFIRPNCNQTFCAKTFASHVMMKLLDELELEYDIVFNKFDKFDVEEQQSVKEKTKKEIELLGLQKVGKVYFVSARNPKMFDDWLAMVNHLTG